MVLLAAGCAQDTGPHLSSASPASAQRLAHITIAGERLCGGDCAHAGGQFVITLAPDGPVQLIVETVVDTQAQLLIPNAADIGHSEITLTVNDQSSNALAFEVLP